MCKFYDKSQGLETLREDFGKLAQDISGSAQLIW